MGCPFCRSEFLVIRQKTGWEWFVLHFTELRKYKCIGCGRSFRAPDRRRKARPPSGTATVPAEIRENADQLSDKA